MTSSMAFLGASSSSFSSSSSTHPRTYDVFLSFRGEDTRNNFTAHLYHALCQNGINTYIDDYLERGEEISLALLKSIEESRISVVVLSKNYASSRWCLDELIKILECKEKYQQIVVPIFYDVDPSEVRNQTSSVGNALFEIEARLKDDIKIQKWKMALKEVASLSGWHLRTSKSESQFIQEIAQWLNSRIISHAELFVAKYPIGIQPRLQHLHSLLSLGKNTITMIGIYGASGIGKTTIAKALYNSIASQFDGSCFLPNVRETSQKKDLIYLQNKLLSKVLRVSCLEVDSVDQGIAIIKQRFRSRKIFLVLDDVNDSIQLENLAGRHDWFGLGSKIIITTRDKGLLSKHGVDLQYCMNELNAQEALELFSWNAFKSMKPTTDFVEITKEVLSYARGLPLALGVMGSNLFGKSLTRWKSTLERYKRIPNKDIQNILKVSYDELDDNEKDIFLDITCFFVGNDLDYVCKLLDKCGLCPNHGIEVLVNKSLITITEHERLEMHNLLQDMGKEIVRQESPEDPGKRSRLWYHEDICRVLEENTGTKKVEGILIDLPKERLIRLSPMVFKKMRNLRLFINRNAKFSKAPNFLSNELRILDWSGFPGEFFPSNFHGEKLITLNIRGSALKRFQTIQNFQNLFHMTFYNCDFLRELPDISRIPNLEILQVTGCHNLVTVHPWSVSHDKLRALQVFNCLNLKSLPRTLKMSSLSQLYFWGCPRLKNFPEMECPLELSLASLSASNTEELPLSWEFIQPGEPHQSGCIVVDSFLNMIHPSQSRHSIEFATESKTSLSAESLLVPLSQTNSNVCQVGRTFPMTSGCSSQLVSLDLSKTNIISLPNCIQDCCHLRYLYLSDCRKLKEVSRLPPYLDSFSAVGCKSLEYFRLSNCHSPWISYLNLIGCRLLGDIENVIQFYLSEDYPKYSTVEVIYTGHEIPDWFSYKNATIGNSCAIDIVDLYKLEGEIKGILFCVVAEKDIQKFKGSFFKRFSIDVICNGLKISPDQEFVNPIGLAWDGITLIFRSFGPSKLKGDSMQVCFRFEEDLSVLVSCGVHLILKQDEKATDLARKRPLDDNGSNLESNQFSQRKKRLSISSMKKFKRHLSISGVKKFKRRKSSEQEQSSSRKHRKKKKKTAIKNFRLL